MKDNRNIKVLVCFFIIKKSSYYSGYSYYLTDYFMEKMNGRLGLKNLEPGFEVSVYLRIV